MDRKMLSLNAGENSENFVDLVIPLCKYAAVLR
jgi:hypothetical protein